jgi:hypothetical protein
MISVYAPALADNFQFYYKNASNVTYLSYESIRLYDKNNTVVFSGFTDKFGRIVTKVKAGTYVCRIVYQKREYKISLTIDNKADFKTVYFGSSIKPYLIKRV